MNNKPKDWNEMVDDLRELASVLIDKVKEKETLDEKDLEFIREIRQILLLAYKMQLMSKPTIQEEEETPEVSLEELMEGIRQELEEVPISEEEEEEIEEEPEEEETEEKPEEEEIEEEPEVKERTKGEIINPQKVKISEQKEEPEKFVLTFLRRIK